MRAQRPAKAPRMLRLCVEEHEALAMFAGTMTQKRVPLRVRWKPRGETQEIETRRPFASADVGEMFWVAEPCVWYQGKGTWEAMEHTNYGWGVGQWTQKPPQVPRWKSERFRPEHMPPALHRMQVRVLHHRTRPLVDISDVDMAREAIADRANFLREYREVFGERYAQLGSECSVVEFEVVKRHLTADVTVKAGEQFA